MKIYPLAASLAIAVVACLAYYTYQRALPKPLPGIPYDEAAARNVLGSMPSMLSHLKKHGVVLPWLFGHNEKHRAPLIQFFGAPFAKPTLVLCDFQESQDVLLRRTKDFDRARRSFNCVKHVIPESHLGMPSAHPQFKGNKELIRDLMNPSFLHEVSAPQIYAKSCVLVELWSEKAKLAKGNPFEAHRDIVDAAMDMINAVAFDFGTDLSITKQKMDYLNSQPEDAYCKDAGNGSIGFTRPEPPKDIVILQTAAEFLGSQTISPFPDITYWYTRLMKPSILRDVDVKDEIIKKHIKMSFDRLEAGDKTQSSALDHIIQRETTVARKENRAPNIYSRRIVDELFTYIVGGHETTSSALSWMIKVLGDYQDEQQKVRDSLRATFADALSEGRQPTASEIVHADAPQLDAFIEECLRIFSPTPMFAREAIVDTVLLGHHIPKGVTLLFNNAGPGFLTQPLADQDMKRSESSVVKNRSKTWNADDLRLFKPERWLKEENGKTVYDSQAGPFLTFSLGPRGCFGRRLAYLELRLVMTLLIWNFRFGKLDGALANYDTKESVTVMPKNCYVALERL
ncbi:Cytochrome P450 monooxygenase TRI13 [Paramyrothecium foliicola]|nr:Cytochrome P450 monooxygenase TRI13 [Paramyrothecium foliicola]